MTYEEAKQIVTTIEARINAARAILRTYPSNEIGLTSDNIKFSPEYRVIKADFNRAFAELQKFNRSFVKVFAKEIRNERKQRFAA